MSAAQVRAYATKAGEYLAAAEAELGAGRHVAATSLAIHAAINAADVVTGSRIGRRAAAQNHDEVLAMLRDAGPDGAEVHRQLIRLLPLKTTAEYDPDDIPGPAAGKAVERARAGRSTLRTAPVTATTAATDGGGSAGCPGGPVAPHADTAPAPQRLHPPDLLAGGVGVGLAGR